MNEKPRFPSRSYLAAPPVWVVSRDTVGNGFKPFPTLTTEPRSCPFVP